MQDVKVQEISPVSASSCRSTKNHVPDYMELARRDGLRVAVTLLRENLGHKRYIWLGAFRSFLGHIRTQSAKGLASVRVGSPRHHGSLNVRSLFRRVCIEKLMGKLPWVDCQDLDLFLMGFDAGENWAYHNRNECRDQESGDASWFTPEIVHEINLTIDMLKRKWYKSQYESAKHPDPSQSH